MAGSGSARAPAERSGRGFFRGSRRGPRDARRADPSAAALSARGRHASCFRRASAAGRRHGARQDHSGHRRLRVAGASRRNRTRSRRLPGLAKGRVGRTDRPFLRTPRPSRVRTARPAPRRLSRTGLLHDRQLRTGARRRRRHKRPIAAGRRRAGRGATHQELAHEDGAPCEIVALSARFRAHWHAGGESHRRTLFDRPISRPRNLRAAVPLQSRFLRTRRTRTADRLQEPCHAT